MGIGIDYDASFGIGVEVEEIKCGKDVNWFDMYGYLEELLENTDYKYAEYGDGVYTGGYNTFIITIKDPFKDGYDLTEKVKKMEEFLITNNIEFDRIKVVGGLYVC
jgi:hypothetical protein